MIVDVETGGFNPKLHALLEVAIVITAMDDAGVLYPAERHDYKVEPFLGSKLDQAALKFNGIDPFDPQRQTIHERDALLQLFQVIRRAVRETECTRAVLVGHNPAFDLSFIHAAVERNGIKRNPFHPFSTFDTATLSALAFGQTVLARAAQCAGLPWDNKLAHSAAYDAERTAELFCTIVNRWRTLNVRHAVDPQTD